MSQLAKSKFKLGEWRGSVFTLILALLGAARFAPSLRKTKHAGIALARSELLSTRGRLWAAGQEPAEAATDGLWLAPKGSGDGIDEREKSRSSVVWALPPLG